MCLRTFLAALILLSASLSVFADNINLTFTEATGNGTVSLNATATHYDGQYLINSASGSINGLTVVSLVAPGGIRRRASIIATIIFCSFRSTALIRRTLILVEFPSCCSAANTLMSMPRGTVTFLLPA